MLLHVLLLQKFGRYIGRLLVDTQIFHSHHFNSQIFPRFVIFYIILGRISIE